MAIRKKWLVYCTTDNQYEEEWRLASDGAPTECPVDGGHGVGDIHIAEIDRDFSITSDPTADDDDDRGYQVGDQWLNSASGALWICTDNTVGAAVWTLTGDSAFGSGSYAERTSPTLSTTSTNWSQALRLTTDSLEAGTYRVGWMTIVRNSNAGGDWRIRVQVDDTTDLIDPDNGGYAGKEAKDGGSDQREGASGFRYVALGAGVHNIDLDLSQNGNGTATLFHAVLEIWRAS